MNVARHYVMIAKIGCERLLAAEIKALAAKIRPLPGCLGVECFRDAVEPAHFIFLERWEDMDAQRAAGALLGREAFAPIMESLAARPDTRTLSTFDQL